MTSECGAEDGHNVQQEHTALPVGETVLSSVEPFDLGAGYQPSAHLAPPALDWQISPTRAHREWRLPSVPSSVTTMRWGLRAFLGDAGLAGDELEDLILAACEAASNALEHAQHSTEPFFDVATQITDDVVTIVVHDHGQWRAPTSSPHRGRGLAMMSVLADTSVAVGDRGTTVTLRSHRLGAQSLAEGEGEAS